MDAPSSPAPAETAQHETPWSARDVVLAFLCGFVVGIVLGAAALLLQSVAGVELSTSAQVSAVSILIYVSISVSVWYFALKKHRAPRSRLGLTPVEASTILLMVPVVVALLIVNAFIVAAVSILFGVVENPQQDALAPGGVLSSGDFLWLLVVAAMVAPVAEELMFRGMLYRYLRKRHRLVVATVMSALLFAVVHVTPILLPSLFVLGVALALIVERYGSIYPAMALHALNNGIALVAIYATTARP